MDDRDAPQRPLWISGTSAASVTILWTWTTCLGLRLTDRDYFTRATSPGAGRDRSDRCNAALRAGSARTAPARRVRARPDRVVELDERAASPAAGARRRGAAARHGGSRRPDGGPAARLRRLRPRPRHRPPRSARPGRPVARRGSSTTVVGRRSWLRVTLDGRCPGRQPGGRRLADRAALRPRGRRRHRGLRAAPATRCWPSRSPGPRRSAPRVTAAAHVPLVWPSGWRERRPSRRASR